MTATQLAEPPLAPGKRMTDPSPGRGRYALLVVVLLLVGSFAGNLLSDQFLRASWFETVDACLHSVNHSEEGTPVVPPDDRCR